MSSAVALAPRIGIAVACAGLGVSRATFYRSLQRRPVNASMVPRSRSPWALSLTEG